MWGTQISSGRDIFSLQSSSELQDYSISSENYSQLQNSQTEFSQFSQDLHTQQNSGGYHSQTDTLGTSLFEKYMAASSGQQTEARSGSNTQTSNKHHPSLSTKPQLVKSQKPVMNFHQQMQMNKIRAREKDERDLLSGAIATVETCCEEMKQSFQMFKDNFNKQEGYAADKLLPAIGEIMDKMNENYSSVLSVLQAKDERQSKISELQAVVTTKESKIEKLEKQVSELQEKHNTQVVSAVTDCLADLQSVTERKLQQVLDRSLEQLEQSRGQAVSTRKQLEDSTKLQQELKWSNQTKLQEIEKRILDELLQLRSDFDSQKKDLEYILRHQSQLASQNQSREIHSEIQRGLETNTRLTLDHVLQANSQHETHFKDLWEKQQQSLQSLIKSQIEESEKRVQLVPQDNSKLPWKFSDSYPENIKNQLENLHRTHVEQVKKIQTEMESYQNQLSKKKDSIINACSDPDSFIKPMNNLFTSASKEKSEASIQINEMSRQMFSPGARNNGWNSRFLFSRPQPSPVATVLPQRKEDQPQTQVEKQIKKGKKDKTTVLPQRRSQRIELSNISFHSNGSSQRKNTESSIIIKNTSSNVKRPGKGCQRFQSNHCYSKEDQQTIETSPTLSDVSRFSCESSPTLSVMKVVIRRKVKRMTDSVSNKSPNLALECQEKTDPGDFLSTPNLISYPQNEVPPASPKELSNSHRRGGKKRRLCNYESNMKMMEIRQSLNQTIQTS